MMDVLISKQKVLERLEWKRPEIGADGSRDRHRYMQWYADREAVVMTPPALPDRCENCVNFSKTRLLIPQPEQRWMPVTKKLPDELAEVNITWVNTDPEPYYDFVRGKPNTGTGIYYKGRWYWYSAVCVDYLKEYGFSPNDGMDDAIKVLAWMPLPEPYREEGGV